MFIGNTSAPRMGTDRVTRAGRTELRYRLGMGALLLGLAAATPWLQLSFQGNDPFSQLIALVRSIGARYLLLGAAVLAGLVVVVGGIAMLVSIALRRPSADARPVSCSFGDALEIVREPCGG
jgi:hypothetical protein